MLHRVVTGNELIVSIMTDISARSTRIAERFTSQVDITVGISTHQPEETVATEFVGTTLTQFVATCALVACEQLDYESWQLEETVHEGTCHHTAPVSGHQATQR